MGAVLRPDALFACLLAACAQPAAPPPAAATFAYDTSRGRDFREASFESDGSIAVRDLSFAAYDPRHGRIKAWLVEPGGAGPFAAVLYFHWLGETDGNRDQFLPEARALAEQGVVSLLIQGYFPWSEPPVSGLADRRQIEDQTIDLRRSLDLLLARPGVDASRVAFVGHDYGAMFGALAAGSESRVKAYVLIATIGSFSDWSLAYWPETAVAGEDAYRVAVRDVEPIDHISRAAPAALFFQFAGMDAYISDDAARRFYESASNPKRIRWYPADHHMDNEQARADRHEWLSQQLGLPRDS